MTGKAQIILASCFRRYLEIAAQCATEQCGLLIGRIEGDAAIVDELRATPNKAAKPATTFEIDPTIRLKVQRSLRETARQVVGIYHTHPKGNARPSQRDQAGARNEPGLIWLIAAQEDICAYGANAEGLTSIRLL